MAGAGAISGAAIAGTLYAIAGESALTSGYAALKCLTQQLVTMGLNKSKSTFIMIITVILGFSLTFLAMYGVQLYGIQSINDRVVTQEKILGLNKYWAEISLVTALCSTIPLYIWLHVYLRPNIPD